MAPGINGSDLVALMGLNPNVGPFAVYVSKVDPSGSVLTENLRREALVPYVSARYQTRTTRRLVSVEPYQQEWRVASVDRVVLTGDQITPALNTEGRATMTHNSPKFWADILLTIACPASDSFHQWGPETDALIEPRGARAVPIRYIIESVWNMHITGVKKCDLVALIDDEIRVYGIKYDLMFADAIESAASAFQQQHIEKKLPPEPDYRASSREYLFKKHSQPTTGTMLAPTQEAIALAQHLQATKDFLRHHGMIADELTNKLCAIVGDAEGIEELCTWKKDTKGRVDWESLVAHMVKEEMVSVRSDTDAYASLVAKFRNPTRRFRLLGDTHEQ